MHTQILRRLIISTLALSFTLGIGVAFADPFDDSIAAYDRGDYASAVRLFRPLAELRRPQLG
jgi:hypothetical protein